MTNGSGAGISQLSGKRAGAAVKLAAVGKSYGSTIAVKPLDLTIGPGELVTLLGPSGCGKTTLLRMIAGLEQPSQGRIFIADRDVTLLSPGERNVSMVFQSYALFPHMSVLDNICYGLVSGGASRAAAAEKAKAVMSVVGLAGFGDRMPYELSGGQQQRVAVARALVLEPAVLLFDEPLSNLDARLRRHMRDEIRELQQRLAVTVVYVTHDQSEALAVSDRIVVMRDAEIAQVGTPESLYLAPESAFVAKFMGEANHLNGRIERINGAMADVMLGSLRLSLPSRGFSPGPVSLIARPESILLRQPEPDGKGLVGRVLRATYMGSHFEYSIDSELGVLFVIAPRLNRLFNQGDPLTIEFSTDGVILVAD